MINTLYHLKRVFFKPDLLQVTDVADVDPIIELYQPNGDHLTCVIGGNSGQTTICKQSQNNLVYYDMYEDTPNVIR